MQLPMLGPCEWDIPDPPCQTDKWESLTAEARHRAKSTAAFLLWGATGRQFGRCEQTIRPCKESCGQYWPIAGQSSCQPWSMLNWGRSGPCGCSDHPCSCSEVCEVELPGWYPEPVKIMLHGYSLDLRHTRVDNGRYLVLEKPPNEWWLPGECPPEPEPEPVEVDCCDSKCGCGGCGHGGCGCGHPDSGDCACDGGGSHGGDHSGGCGCGSAGNGCVAPSCGRSTAPGSCCGGSSVSPPRVHPCDDSLIDLCCWPKCQDLSLPDTAIGTWSITFKHGIPLPLELRYAAADLALEVAKACNGDACTLPSGVTSVVRQGVSYDIERGLELSPQGAIRKFNISSVDSIIATLNPYGVVAPMQIVSPDLPSGGYGRTTTWRPGWGHHAVR